MAKRETTLEQIQSLLVELQKIEELTELPIGVTVRGRKAFPGLGMDIWFANTPTECNGCTGCEACQGCTGCAGTASAQSAALKDSIIRAIESSPAGS